MFAPPRLRSAALGLAIALTLSGCAESPKPSAPPTIPPEDAQATSAPAPSPSADASTSASPAEGTPTPAPSRTRENGYDRDADGYPVMPPLAKKKTPQGAGAFARWYLELISSTARKPQPGVLLRHALPSCKTCSGFDGGNRENLANGTHLDGLKWTLGQPVQIINAGGGTWLVHIPTTQRPIQRVDKQGTVVKTIEEGSTVNQVALRWTETGWAVETIKVVRFVER